ncbi:MAG: T9SS type A sorting domain-containing protein, partial [Bacteroidales bacterium]|nr:T9SS type A sorting domain-containing protein [Bacteroidales bacterium]
LKASDITSIDISTFVNGIYYFSINQNGKTWTEKIIKE